MSEKELLGKEVLGATIIGGGISETKEGKPQALMTLEDEKGRMWTWTGSFNDGPAREITMKALQSAGFVGSINDLAAGRGFSEGYKVSITIDDEWNKEKTKSYRRVKWVNSLNKGAQMMAEADALIKLKGMGLDADFAAMFGATTAPVGSNPKKEDVPF